MPNHTQATERLDLQFRVSPPPGAGIRLPGGIWLWFALGVMAGTLAWNYGYSRLAKHLSERLHPTTPSSTALVTLEAASILNGGDDGLLIQGLLHSDPQVARSAMEKLNDRLDIWSARDSAENYALMRQLADRLGKLQTNLPEANAPFARSLAARLYATCVSNGDPQLGPVAETCLSLLGSTEGSDKFADGQRVATALSVPPRPLAGYTNESPQYARSLIETDFRSAQSVYSLSGYTDSQAGSVFGTRPSIDGTSAADLTIRATRTNAANLGHWATGSSVPFAFDAKILEPDDAMLLADKVTAMTDSDASEVESPEMAQTPATIVSPPVARMTLISNRPNYAGLEKAEIAELIRLLGVTNPDLAKAATIALRHKGFNDFEIELAAKLAVGSAVERLELLQQISTSGKVAPQPWLVWMAEDGQPEVRRMAISLLSSMLDPDVERSLRILLAHESDPTIQDLIRKILLRGSRITNSRR